mmetsp:Transcript_22944/g.17391  ORF Transcript_22944/g.17391 Transcript_22944/m.17391 type:complete len:82 (+) Transcript_22944:128-373(+)
MISQSPFGLAADIQWKIDNFLKAKIEQFRKISQDSSIFSSTADHVQELTIQIKDGITEVQADIEEVQRHVKQQTNGTKTPS